MTKLIPFQSSITTLPLPETFSYPYYYTTQPIAERAAEELQAYLSQQTDFNHNFGLENPNTPSAIGKMFGVLVVTTKSGTLGYLAAFSGKLAEQTLLFHFVPPVYNILNTQSFYKAYEHQLNTLTAELHHLKNHPSYTKVSATLKQQKAHYDKLFSEAQRSLKARRKARKAAQQANNQLNINEEFYLREYATYIQQQLQPLEDELAPFTTRINSLNIQRKAQSAWLQQEIFKHYAFLNANKESKTLADIFNEAEQPIPAGAGDCCAPKLLHYAYLNDLTPIAMAEFWWGKPLTTSVRKHKTYYPACTGKCKPILTHMLTGLDVAPNPLIAELSTHKDIAIIYEDAQLLVVNKPAELLSAPGKQISDSVYTRIREQYPDATGPLLVHRLDMSTSGLLLIAKNKDSHKHLQAQFENRTVKKRYVAVLDGRVNAQKGTIRLPLRVDLNDRPKQLVCHEHGKPAVTHWEVVCTGAKHTRVHLYPVTGRTHQLRVHMAHTLGLNTPIIGDELYGQASNRLHLHAEYIEFTHPTTNITVVLTTPPPF